jgi:D-glycerate 3-kinase
LIEHSLAGQIARWHAAAGKGLIIGLSGCQGSGKTRLARLLGKRLRAAHGVRAAAVSLDDFYLPKAERARLSRSKHVLFGTRGVPGTHDLGLIQACFGSVLAQNGPVSVPFFDKSTDDRAPMEAWPRVETPVDVLIFEGWCLGATPQSKADLAAPINALEAEEDADGSWRHAVNAELAGGYAALWARLDHLVLLQAPGWEVVEGWRAEAETRMTAAELSRFMQHYERIGRAMLAKPPRADIVIRLDAERRVLAAGD